MRRDVSKLKLPFGSYIISNLSQGIIIIEKNQGGCTRRSAPEAAPFKLSFPLIRATVESSPVGILI